jgi:hypothetical protein
MLSIHFFGCVGYFETQFQKGFEPVLSFSLACKFDLCERLVTPPEE